MWENSVFYYEKEFQEKFDELMKIVVEKSYQLRMNEDIDINKDRQYFLLKRLKAIYGECAHTPMADI